MRRKKNPFPRLLLAVILVYLVLLFILYSVESVQPETSIHTLADAFWFSLATLTTVGYGDLLPVTTLGRIIGVVFLLMSTGILVALVSTVVSFLAGEALPFFYLRLKRKRDWYYFASYTDEAHTLAANIYAEDSKAIIIFGNRDEREEQPDFPCLFINSSIRRLVEEKQGVGSRIKVFFLKENDIRKNSRAIRINDLPLEIYACTSTGYDSLPGISFFHPYDCVAREYWRTRPLLKSEKHIVILGFGHYGRAILRRAILTNIIDPDQSVNYHIVGNGDAFFSVHERLGNCFRLKPEDGDKGDGIFFHKERWSDLKHLYRDADRIIICDDNEDLGWDMYWKLTSYLIVKGRIDLRSNRKVRGVNYFGTTEKIFTPQHIMRTKLTEAAIAFNELFRQTVPYPTLPWEELDNLWRQSKIAAADHILMKIRILLKNETITKPTRQIVQMAYQAYRKNAEDPAKLEYYRRIDHMQWSRFYYYCNWTFGPVQLDEEKQHPQLLPFEELTPEQKKKKDLSWKLLGKFAEVYESEPLSKKKSSEKQKRG